MGAPAGGFHVAFAGWVGRALVKGHRHIRTQGHLNGHGALWGEIDSGPIPGGAKDHPAVVDRVDVAQAEDLKAA